MDINYTFSITGVSEEDISNIFTAFTSMLSLVKESNLDSYKNGELRSKVSELESKNRNLELQVETLKDQNDDLKRDLNFAEKKEVKAAIGKKATTKKEAESYNFNEV